MVKAKIVIGLLGVALLFPLAVDSVQAESRPLHQRPTISVLGRLALEQSGQKERLVLHAKNAETYLIKGNLIQELKNLLSEFGENHLVFVTGKQDGKSSVVCEYFRKYEYDDKGEGKFKTDVKCIRYWNLEVIQVLFAKKSDEPIPPPKREIEEERRLIAGKNILALEPPVITGEIYGKVISVNLKSPIKTIEIANRDKSSPIKDIILMITPDTRIVKKIGEQEPMALAPEALRSDQEVTAVFFRDEFKSEALYITITKE
jgi:hypothetical protein